jgi:hypothetical protein
MKTVAVTFLLLVASALSQTYKVVHSYPNTGAGGSQVAFAPDAGSFYRMTDSSLGVGSLLNWITPPKTGTNWPAYDMRFGAYSGSGRSVLTTDAQGNLYGTCRSGPGGGTHGPPPAAGCVFETKPGAANTRGTETYLYEFTGGADGGSPLG